MSSMWAWKDLPLLGLPSLVAPTRSLPLLVTQSMVLRVCYWMTIKLFAFRVSISIIKHMFCRMKKCFVIREGVGVGSMKEMSERGTGTLHTTAKPVAGELPLKGPEYLCTSREQGILMASALPGLLSRNWLLIGNWEGNTYYLKNLKLKTPLCRRMDFCKSSWVSHPCLSWWNTVL